MKTDEKEIVQKPITVETADEILKKQLQMFSMYKNICPKCKRPLITCICRKNR
jgi:hypothetical protein